MIRVNLIRDQTVRIRKAAARPRISRAGLMFVATLLVLAAGLGVWWYYIHNQIETITATRDRLRLEDARIQSWKKEIREFERLKKLRQSRIEVIEKLKESQTGPVVLLSQVIQCIPGDSSLWLTLLDQKGDRVQIGGYALRGESVPDFMTNLSSSGIFKTVDLETIEDDKDTAKFSLVCISQGKRATE